jgi:hypothetical protein
MTVVGVSPVRPENSDVSVIVPVRLSAHGATQKKLIGHANYQPVSTELLPLQFNGMPHTALPVSNPLVTRH